MNNSSRILPKNSILPKQQITKNITKSQPNLIKNNKIHESVEAMKKTVQNNRVSNFVKRFSCDFKREIPQEHCFQNKDIQTPPEQWHKRSISMKLKTFNFIQNKKPQKGFFMKFRKNQQIYSFRCFKTDDNNENIIRQTVDNDTITDDEQIYIAQRNLFFQLCGSIQNEILEEEDDQKTQPKGSQ